MIENVWSDWLVDRLFQLITSFSSFLCVSLFLTKLPHSGLSPETDVSILLLSFNFGNPPAYFQFHNHISVSVESQRWCKWVLGSFTLCRSRVRWRNWGNAKESSDVTLAIRESQPTGTCRSFVERQRRLVSSWMFILITQPIWFVCSFNVY